MRLLIRLLQRLLIFGLGIFCVWLIVFVVFETADRRLPWILAVGVTYGIAAYIILPRAILVGLKILQRKRVPSYTITGDGLPGDPVNVALVGTLQQLRVAFASLGWSEADRLSLSSSWGMIRAFVFNSAYPTAPFSTLYLFGRGQDVGFSFSQMTNSFNKLLYTTDKRRLKAEACLLGRHRRAALLRSKRIMVAAMR